MEGCSPADVAEAEVGLSMGEHEGETQDVSPLGTHRSGGEEYSPIYRSGS